MIFDLDRKTLFFFQMHVESKFSRKMFSLTNAVIELNSLGVLAFQSFVRSYATYPKAVKYIFHVKNLHLGFVAKSYGLKSQPSHFVTTEVFQFGL